MLIALAACGDDASTEAAIKNGSKADIDAIITDGQTELLFQGVAPGTTSNFKTVGFSTLTALTVKVGTQTSTANLTDGMMNVVTIGEDGTVKSVVATQPSGGEGAW